MSVADLPRAAQPLVTFATVLRRAAFPVSPDQTIAFVEGVGLLGPKGMPDIYRAARALFAIPRPREAEFTALFNAHFLGQTIAAPLEGDDEDEVEAREARGDSQDVPLDEDDIEPGAEATTLERLAAREIRVLDLDSVLTDFSRRAPGALPRRRSRRRTAHAKGDRPDMRRAIREAARRDGEALTLPRTRRRMRQRRIVLLIDVSGSMTQGIDPAIRLGHALVHAADHADVFTLGTRLTRITADLRPRDPSRALRAVSASVADLDGGTRLGGALDAFLSVPRFAGLARGAAVVVLSDGLERGDPAQMVAATERLSRLAWRLDWLSPLAGGAGFDPRTRAMAAIRPSLSALGDGSSAAAVAAHILSLAEAP